MKKLLITLLSICYSCTLFSQNSMNDIIIARGEISISLNPTTNAITVTNEGVNSVYIYDLAGYLTAFSQSNVVNVANLIGIYVVKANTKAGVITGQLLIKKKGFSKTIEELKEKLNYLIALDEYDEYNEYKALLVENDERVDVNVFDRYYDDDCCEYLYKCNRIPEKYFLIELDTTIYTTFGINVNIVRKIKLKIGRYSYTTTDTARISVKNELGNYCYVDIPYRFEYDINKFASGKFGYKIELRTYKNNKYKGTSYFHDIRNAESDSKNRVYFKW